MITLQRDSRLNNITSTQQEGKVKELAEQLRIPHNLAKYFLEQAKFSFYSAQKDYEKSFALISHIGMEFTKHQPSKDVMEIENFASMFKQMNLESDDLLQIYFCYLCEAAQQHDSKHTITRDEFILGFLKLKIRAATDMKKNVMQEDLYKPETFKAVYMFAFKWMSKNTNMITLYEARALWQITIGSSTPMMVKFMNYLNHEDIMKKKISYDVWQMVWSFKEQVKEVRDFDPDSAWPVILLDFVDSLK